METYEIFFLSTVFMGTCFVDLVAHPYQFLRSDTTPHSRVSNEVREVRRSHTLTTQIVSVTVTHLLFSGGGLILS